MPEKHLRLLHQTKDGITQGTAGAWTSCPSSLSSPQGNMEMPSWVLCTKGLAAEKLSLRNLALLKEEILLANLVIICSFLLYLAGSPYSNYKPILTRRLRIQATQISLPINPWMIVLAEHCRQIMQNISVYYHQMVSS